MHRVSARARRPVYKTEPLNLQQPTAHSENGPVSKVRILRVGVPPAARSGSTWQIPHSVQPAASEQERPQVIYARTIRSVPTADQQPQAQNWQHADVSVLEALREYRGPRQHIQDLQERALRALSGFHTSVPTQRITASAWRNPSTLVMCLAVALYALALFLFALLSR